MEGLNCWFQGENMNSWVELFYPGEHSSCTIQCITGSGDLQKTFGFMPTVEDTECLHVLMVLPMFSKCLKIEIFGWFDTVLGIAHGGYPFILTNRRHWYARCEGYCWINIGPIAKFNYVDIYLLIYHYLLIQTLCCLRTLFSQQFIRFHLVFVFQPSKFVFSLFCNYQLLNELVQSLCHIRSGYTLFNIQTLENLIFSAQRNLYLPNYVLIKIRSGSFHCSIL